MFIKFGDSTKKISIKNDDKSSDKEVDKKDEPDSEVEAEDINAIKKYNFFKKLHKKAWIANI